MRQAASQWPLSAHTQTARSVHVWFETHKVTLDQVFSDYFCFFPTHIIPPIFYTHLYRHVVLTGKTNGQNLGSFQEAKFFRKSGSTEQGASITLVYFQLDAQNSHLFTYNTFIKILYMFEHYPALLQEVYVVIVYMQPLVSSLSAGDCLVYRLINKNFVHQVGNQPRLYYDARSTNRQGASRL
jgi:hypothetical protein